MPFAPAEHTAHQFTRLVSSTDDGRALFGCTFARCGATEVRGIDERSPFAIRREAASQRRAGRKPSRGGA